MYSSATSSEEPSEDEEARVTAGPAGRQGHLRPTGPEASRGPTGREHLEPMRRGRLASMLSGTGPSLALGRGKAFERRREMAGLVDGLARAEFAERYGEVDLGPVVVIIPAYLEVDNIGHVLEAMPKSACDLEIAVLVTVDGGDDGTDEVARSHGAYVLRLPVNRGQGLALWLAYEVAIARGARYIVTLDADGQNDPGEIPGLLAPLVADEADFVVASRRLGVDRTVDLVRKAGVITYGAAINHLTGLALTDTSNGFRAIRAEVLEAVTLEQEQYQTAELIISAAMHGFRITERPTVWRPRLSGSSKKGSNLTFGLNYARVIAATWLRDRPLRAAQPAPSRDR
jgi:hypothetical protein